MARIVHFARCKTSTIIKYTTCDEHAIRFGWVDQMAPFDWSTRDAPMHRIAVGLFGVLFGMSDSGKLRPPALSRKNLQLQVRVLIPQAMNIIIISFLLADWLRTT